MPEGRGGKGRGDLGKLIYRRGLKRSFKGVDLMSGSEEQGLR